MTSLRDDGVTIAIEPCVECPPLHHWPTRSLILGLCPRCGAQPAKRGVVRELRARRLLDEREAAK